jgi:hypothetical protein
MYVAIVPNRTSPPAILLREKYHEDGKTETRTLANLSGWSSERLESLQAVLRGDKLLPADQVVQIERTLPHGHVLAALATARRAGLEELLPRRGAQRKRDLAYGLIIARLLEPAAKLATARMLDPATASHSLGETLGLGSVSANEVYATLDWLGQEQDFIETTLARRHLKGSGANFGLVATSLCSNCFSCGQHSSPYGGCGFGLNLKFAEVELVFANAVEKFDTGDGDFCSLELLEAEYGTDPGFYRTMVLFNDIIEIF